MTENRSNPQYGLTESSPLLADEPRSPVQRELPPVASIARIQLPQVHNGDGIVNMLCFITFAANAAGGLMGIPEARIVEDALCREYYGTKHSFEGPISEDMCKLEPIQSKLAYILATSVALDAIVAFSAALPWSIVVDRIGRKPVLALGFIGITIGFLWVMLVISLPNIFPVRFIWLGSLGQLIGGGNPVLVAQILSMVTDATTDGERAVVFMRVHVASICGKLLSPSLSSVIMQRAGPWCSLWMGIILFIICSLSTMFIPETWRAERTGLHEQDEPRKLSSRLSSVASRFTESLSILKAPSLILLIISSLASTMPVNEATSSFMAQYLSKRYHTRLFQGGYVQSAFGIAQVIQALVILPWLSNFLMQSTTPPRLRMTDEHHRDLVIARWSYGITVAAVAFLGLAPNLPSFDCGLLLLAVGSGYSSLARSLMSLYVDSSSRSRLFCIVGMTDVIGSIYSQPMLAGLFSWGMKLGGCWIGLPYWSLTFLLVPATVLLLFVRVPTKDVNQPASQE